MKNNQSQKNIPNRWSEISVGNVFTFIKSYAFSRDNLSNGIVSDQNIGNIHYGDIHSTFTSSKIDLNNITIPIVKDSIFEPKEEDLLKDGDLIMADASEDYEGVGVTVLVYGLKNKKVVGGLHTFVLRDSNGQTSEFYRQYIFRNPVIRNKLQKVANGVSVYGISKTAVSKIKLSIPPLPEQNRIVAVLEVWDRAIEKLGEKIEIKKNIKKGIASQIMNCELLIINGKKIYAPKLRLPGFSGEWENVKLGDMSIIKRGDMITKKVITNGIVPVIAGGQQPAYYHNKSNRDGLTITVSGSGAYAGYVDFYNYPIFVSDGMSIQEKNLDINFIYYFLKLKQDYIYSLQTGGAQPHIYPKDLQKLKLNIPKSKEEQTAIAQIFTTADLEIETLEKKKKIIEDQKKFLLNNLVTGNIIVNC